MPFGASLGLILVLCAAFLLVCVVASKISAKSGIPALVLFLGIGMLAGSDGPGGIHFSDMALTKTLGTLALAFILFAGGLETNWQTLKKVALKGAALSTIGVAITCALIGAFAHYVLKLPPMIGLLLGAVVSSTDAAAIFGVLRSSGTRLKHNLTPLLEFESGTNDPVAVFLTIAMTEIVKHPGTSMVNFIPELLIEMPLGFAIGLVAGWGAVALINRVRLEYDGLYSIITVATVCFAFGGAEVLHGNPFLAVYVAGVTMGSRKFLHRLALIQFHDAIAWLTQIVMFVVLGLLVYPRQLLDVAVPGLLLSLFLIFVARPVSVGVALLLSKMPFRSKVFVSWAGLRGAVPIILATFPAIAGVPEAQMIFNLVFFIVLTSVLIQGSTLRPFARLLGVGVDRNPDESDLTPASNEDLLEVSVQPGSRTVGRQVVDLGLPPTALIVLLTRNDESYIPRGSTVLAEGDKMLIATRLQDREELKKRFE